MGESILKIKQLVKSFGSLQATNNLDLDVKHGVIHALIGPNGAGKTTLISQISGWLAPDLGSIYFKGTEVTGWPVHKRALAGLARTYQITSVFSEFSVLENVALAVQAHDGHSFRFWGSVRRDPRLRESALAALGRVGLADRADILVSELAHGEQRLLELAMALATKPSMLLLDEPMAGMAVEETAQVVEVLQSLRGTVSMLLVEHDMDAVFALADRLTVLVYGQNIATGSPDEIRSDAAVREAYLGEECEC